MLTDIVMKKEISMKYENLKMNIFIIIIIYLVSSIIAQDSSLTGNDVVKLGSLNTFEGKLIRKDSDLFLETEDKQFKLHLAPEEFLKEKQIVFTLEKQLRITGFHFKQELAIVNFVIGERIFELRKESGEPLWNDAEFSKKEKKAYIVNPKKCIGCQLCVFNCPTEAISMVNGIAVIDPENCINCGICANGYSDNFKGCPVKAIYKNY